jgi:hypothetical protein
MHKLIYSKNTRAEEPPLDVICSYMNGECLGLPHSAEKHGVNLGYKGPIYGTFVEVHGLLSLFLARHIMDKYVVCPLPSTHAFTKP